MESMKNARVILSHKRNKMFGPTTLTVDFQLILKGLLFGGSPKKKHNKLKQNLVGGLNPFERC